MSDSTKKHLIAGLVSAAVMVILLALMDINFCGWLGVWFVRQMPYAAGIPLTIMLGFGASFAYSRSLAKTNMGPGPIRGLVFGLILAALFIWIMPWFLSSIVGEATGVTTVGKSVGAFDVFPKTFGGHYEPIPSLGFDTPLENLADEAWYNTEDWKGRLVPFGIAFAAMGLVLGLMINGKKN